MFIVNSYVLAVVLCVVTMICWGSWGNTQKLAAKSWRYELFYWDYVIGILLFSLLYAPVIADLSDYLPASRILSLLSPASWYLRLP